MFDDFYGVVPEAVLNLPVFVSGLIVILFVWISMLFFTAVIALMIKGPRSTFDEVWIGTEEGPSGLLLVNTLAFIGGIVFAFIVNISYGSHEREHIVEITQSVVEEHHIKAALPELSKGTLTLHLKQEGQEEAAVLLFEEMLLNESFLNNVNTVEFAVYAKRGDAYTKYNHLSKEFDVSILETKFANEISNLEEIVISEDEVMEYAVQN